MSSRLAVSVVYIVGFTAVGWVFMKVTEPKEDKLKAVRETTSLEHLSEDAKRKHLIVQRLKEAAGVDKDK